MTEQMEIIKIQAQQAMQQLLGAAGLQPGDILVVGCSSSEITGGCIGKHSSMEAAEAVYEGIVPVLEQAGVFLAAQCCEHLNRALVVERAALHPGMEVVNVLPQPHAGGSFATVAWRRAQNPVAVESLRAQAGMDIGDTLIGMHLQAVAVPVRLPVRRIGSANLVCARTRPKYIGGARAVYQQEEDIR